MQLSDAIILGSTTNTAYGQIGPLPQGRKQQDGGGDSKLVR